MFNRFITQGNQLVTNGNQGLQYCAWLQQQRNVSASGTRTTSGGKRGRPKSVAASA
jgi:hypothetical protein